MDPTAVAGLAGSALVAAMATDAWQQARDQVVALWRRVRPDGAPAVEGELTELRAVVSDSRHSAEVDAALVRLWQLRLRDLLLADSALTAELTREVSRLTDELAQRTAADEPRIGTVHIEGHATGQGRIYQAGRDLNITES